MKNSKLKVTKENYQGLKFLTKPISNSHSFKKLMALFKQGSFVCNAIYQLRPLLTAAIFLKTKKSILIVTADISKAEQLTSDLLAYLPSEMVGLFPDRDSLVFEDIKPSVEIVGERSRLLRRLRTEPMVVIAAVQTLAQKLPGPDANTDKPIGLRSGREVRPDSLAAELVDKGYQRVVIVENPGEFARRGSLIDVYPSTASNPVRIDLFGETIESIRVFTAEDQRTISRLESIMIFAGREAGLDASAQLPMGSLIDYLPKATPIIVDETKIVINEKERFFYHLAKLFERTVKPERRLNIDDYFLSSDEVEKLIDTSSSFEELFYNKPQIYIDAKEPEKFYGKIDALKSKLNEYGNSNIAVVLSLKEPGELSRLEQILKENSQDSTRKDLLSPKRPIIRVSGLNGGFVWPEVGLALFGQDDIFPRHKSPERLTYSYRKKELIDFSGLQDGDYLVHENHGIAIFRGLTHKTVDNIDREYLILEYAKRDMLYLPTDQLHKVSRYIGPDSSMPKITRLGSMEWMKATKRVRESVKKLAIDLLSLYQERLQSRGYKFSEDMLWQQELESTFIHQESKDQISAINDVKRDMESEVPMDRLVCGDVGYGKTEVALRASFKAIMDSKQVMMLAPTTILAEQHYLTFKDRFAPYPIAMEMLSRFRSLGEQCDIVNKIKQGRLDMVVGTHRLLQKDLRFKDLGLVIIDEEQRFGVKHKEYLRGIKKEVDVLTLSATPIPRTLQMSLSGIRDLSIIDTPPEGRRPVFTYVGEYRAPLIISAIRRELSRGGQVFYLHNRVSDIRSVASKLNRSFPEANIGIGYGKMEPGALEKTMRQFITKDIDILVCTTIIESGIDIANANTLVVEGAENLGLAQMYQLRGRIGRCGHQAFAYFTYPSNRLLTGASLDRLRTIGKFTELGSGFKIALRDLEIRGAGSLLGAEQHGHLAAVGFDYYCRMLRDAIDELRGHTSVKRGD